jgi:hypothetical protein
MAVDEQRLRQSLHARLADAVGTDEAALLMEYLPPVGWADIATKHDLDAAIAHLEATLLKWLVPTVLAAVGVSVTLARLT